MRLKLYTVTAAGMSPKIVAAWSQRGAIAEAFVLHRKDSTVSWGTFQATATASLYVAMPKDD